MDIDDYNRKAVTTEGGIRFGDDNAPVKVIEYINLRCPFSKIWWESKSRLLDPYLEEGKVERIVKHYDKDKPGLDKGNVLHAYLDYENQKQTWDDIDHYVTHLNDWGNLTKDKIADYAEKKRQAEKQNNEEHVEMILNETEAAKVTHVPTIFIGDHVFDQNISDSELKDIVEKELQDQ